MVYICAWQPAECPPERLISSSTIEPSVIPNPPPPYSAGMSTAR